MNLAGYRAFLNGTATDLPCRGFYLTGKHDALASIASEFETRMKQVSTPKGR